MKKSVLIVLAFLVISLGLTWLWDEWLRAGYAQLFIAAAHPLYDLLGFEDARVVALRQRYINFVPFVSLVLVTPGISVQRRSLGLLLGLIFIFICHLALNLTEIIQPGVALPIVPSIVSDALPFLVWIVIAYPVLAKYLPGPVEPESELENVSETGEG